MEGSQKINCRLGSLEKRTDYSIYSKHFDIKPFPDLNDAKEYVNSQLAMMNNEPYLMLSDLSDIYVNWSAEAKKWVAENEEFNKLCKVQAIVVDSLPTRLVFNLYLSFFKPKSETKFFGSVEEASKFLDKREKQLFN